MLGLNVKTLSLLLSHLYYFPASEKPAPSYSISKSSSQTPSSNLIVQCIEETQENPQTHHTHSLTAGRHPQRLHGKSAKAKQIQPPKKPTTRGQGTEVSCNSVSDFAWENKESYNARLLKKVIECSQAPLTTEPGGLKAEPYLQVYIKFRHLIPVPKPWQGGQARYET